jgi:hypothetical protein
VGVGVSGQFGGQFGEYEYVVNKIVKGLVFDLNRSKRKKKKHQQQQQRVIFSVK